MNKEGKWSHHKFSPRVCIYLKQKINNTYFDCPFFINYATNLILDILTSSDEQNEENQLLSTLKKVRWKIVLFHSGYHKSTEKCREIFSPNSKLRC